MDQSPRSSLQRDWSIPTLLCTPPTPLSSPTPPLLHGDRLRNPLRRSRVLALLGTAALALAGAVALPGTAQAANVLANPGFESGSLSPWTCTGNLGSVVSSPVHGGSKALAGAVSSS